MFKQTCNPDFIIKCQRLISGRVTFMVLPKATYHVEQYNQTDKVVTVKSLI